MEGLEAWQLMNFTCWRLFDNWPLLLFCSSGQASQADQRQPLSWKDRNAVTGFECQSGADLFHAQQDVSRFLGGTLGRRISASEKALEQAKNAEIKASKEEFETSAIALVEVLIAAEQALKDTRQASCDYHHNLQGVGDELHPYALSDNSINGAE